MGNNCYCYETGNTFSKSKNSDLLKFTKRNESSSKSINSISNSESNKKSTEIRYENGGIYKGETIKTKNTKTELRHGKGTQIWKDGTK